MSDPDFPKRAQIVIAHNRVSRSDDPSTRDVLAQVGFVADALRRAGIPHDVVAVDDDGVKVKLFRHAAAVFNLVESAPGAPLFQVEVARAFERIGPPVTGSSSEVIHGTTDKLATRRVLQAAGVAVAPGGRLDPDAPAVLDRVAPPWIIKPALEDASLGLVDGAVTSDPAAAVERARELIRAFAGPALAEHLLPGREFNLSLLWGPDGVEVLPPAEMTFVDFPADQPRIVGWAAKWDEASPAYQRTVRRFLTPEEDGLAQDLAVVARATWSACGLAGYGRVDVRLDESGCPCVLEVNANPCISPDAGFTAAAFAAGLAPEDVVRRILLESGWTP